MHNDYHCCAICDDKIAYSDNARRKEGICSFCNAELINHGVMIHGVISLVIWMAREKPEGVYEILDDLGFRKCQYPNAVDELYNEIQTKVEGR